MLPRVQQASARCKLIPRLPDCIKVSFLHRKLGRLLMRLLNVQSFNILGHQLF